jgi:hypothetical protein
MVGASRGNALSIEPLAYYANGRAPIYSDGAGNSEHSELTRYFAVFLNHMQMNARAVTEWLIRENELVPLGFDSHHPLQVIPTLDVS